VRPVGDRRASQPQRSFQLFVEFTTSMYQFRVDPTIAGEMQYQFAGCSRIEHRKKGGRTMVVDVIEVPSENFCCVCGRRLSCCDVVSG
jgi:hypothetical protein